MVSLILSAIQTNNIQQVASDGTLGGLFCMSSIIALGLIVVSFLSARILYRMGNGVWSSFWLLIERHLSFLFALAWVFGFCVYCVGMYIGGESTMLAEDCLNRLLRVAPMAVIHAFEMFLLESDVSSIHDEFHQSLCFMTCFSIAHFLAAFVSLAFVIKHFGYNMVAKVQLWSASHSLRKTNILYLFWGTNKPSYYLAKDIKRHDVQNRILFVKTADSKEDTGRRFGVDRLLDFLSLKNSELDMLKELECLSTTSFSRLSRCELNDTDKREGCSILNKMFGLNRVVKLMDRTASELHIFFLGENEEDNITATANICCDIDIQAFAKSKTRVVIYCHARYDSVNRVVEEANSNGDIDVKIVDSSHNCMKELMVNKDCHPINFVDVDTEYNVGAVKSKFTSMVVGFGENGRDVARFLYEFGAFVSMESSTQEDVPGQNNIRVRRSDFKCHAVDTNMSVLKQRFLASKPAINADASDEGMEFHSCDVETEDFQTLLQKCCDELNYVVVALGDDELSISTAIRIFKFIRSNRADLSKFKIFVRCHDSLYVQHMKAIANHYNQLSDESHSADDEHIVIYGSVDNLYTYSQIVKNQFEMEGLAYNHAYCKVSGKGENDSEWWERRHRNLLALHTLDSYSKLRRKETQDTANAYHAITKMLIIKKVCEANPVETPNLQWVIRGGSPCIPVFRRNGSGGEGICGIISAQGHYTETEQCLFRNLARLEHLRWNASHEMLGYCHYRNKPDVEKLIGKDGNRHECNERYKLHNCLLNWEELDEESKCSNWGDDYKLYDFIVVTTTLQLKLMEERN